MRVSIAPSRIPPASHKSGFLGQGLSRTFQSRRRESRPASKPMARLSVLKSGQCFNRAVANPASKPFDLLLYPYNTPFVSIAPSRIPPASRCNPCPIGSVRKNVSIAPSRIPPASRHNLYRFNWMDGSFNRAVANPASKPNFMGFVLRQSRLRFNRAVANPASKPLLNDNFITLVSKKFQSRRRESRQQAFTKFSWQYVYFCFNRAVANPASKPAKRHSSFRFIPLQGSTSFQSRRRESRQQAQCCSESAQGPCCVSIAPSRIPPASQRQIGLLLTIRITFQSRRRESRQQAYSFTNHLPIQHPTLGVAKLFRLWRLRRSRCGFASRALPHV